MADARLQAGSKVQDAARWLVGFLSARGGQAPRADVASAAELVGIGGSTLKRARTVAEVDSVRLDFPSRTVWTVGPDRQMQSDQAVTGSSVGVWPPAPSPADVWRPVLLRDRSTTSVRSVRLWGGQVWVDAASRVLCPGCVTMVPVAELGRVTNRHAVGLPKAGGLLLPMGEDRDERSLTGELRW